MNKDETKAQYQKRIREANLTRYERHLLRVQRNTKLLTSWIAPKIKSGTPLD